MRVVWEFRLNPLRKEVYRSLCPKYTNSSSICNSQLSASMVSRYSISPIGIKTISLQMTPQATYIADLLQPEMVSQLLMACGHFTLFISVGNFFVWNKALGVLTITVSHMLKDVGRFTMLISFMFAAFFTALNVLYLGFSCANSSFSSALETSTVLFWALFAMTGSDNYKLQLTNHTSGESAVEFVGFMLVSWLPTLPLLSEH